MELLIVIFGVIFTMWHHAELKRRAEERRAASEERKAERKKLDDDMKLRLALIKADEKLRLDVEERARKAQEKTNK